MVFLAVADVLVLDLVDVLDLVLALEGFMSLPVDFGLFEAVFVATVSDMVYLFILSRSVFISCCIADFMCYRQCLTSINTPFRTCLH